MPTDAQLASRLPFCVDTLRFEQWLQFIYIPRLTGLLASDLPLPAKSGVAEMAEEAFGRGVGAIERLIVTLRQVDKLLEA